MKEHEKKFCEAFDKCVLRHKLITVWNILEQNGLFWNEFLRGRFSWTLAVQSSARWMPMGV
jgi:hypothetical protein